MAIVVSPTSKAFATTAAGASSAAQAFSLTPDITTDSITSIVVTGDPTNSFVVTNTKYGVAPAVGQFNYNQSTLLTAADATAFSVTFSPPSGTAPGAKTATAEIHYNGNAVADVIRIPLTGTSS